MSKKIHKTHDTFVKELLSHKDSASEFIKLALPPAIHRQLDLENITFLSDTYTTKELNAYLSDIVLKVPVSGTAGEVLVSILIEHKSTIDHFASLHLLTYVANGYAQQRKRNEKLKVIIPVIYYHGKDKWQFRPLDQLFTDVPVEFRMFIPNFQIEMFAIQKYSVQQIHRIAEAKLRTHQLTAEMKTKSMTYADVLKERGLQQGRQEGSLQSRYDFARKLLLRNMPIEEICELTDLTMEEVKKLAVEMV